MSVLLLSCNNTSKKDHSEANVPKSVDLVSESILKKSPILNQSTTLDTTKLALQKEPEQPVTKHLLSKDDLYRDYDGGSDLANFFEIELIDKETYLTNRNSSINYLLYDSLSFIKKDGILRLPLEKGELTLVDNLTEDDQHKEYKYIGQFKTLNMYLVQGLFWEDWSYILYDKKQGREVQSFLGTPYLSIDLKYIMCLEIDSFEGVGNISLYAISENNILNKKYIDPIVEMYVKSWVPFTKNDYIYWGTDGFLYVPAMYSSNFWDAGDNFYGLEQYIRLRPIAS